MAWFRIRGKNAGSTVNVCWQWKCNKVVGDDFSDEEIETLYVEISWSQRCSEEHLLGQQREEQGGYTDETDAKSEIYWNISSWEIITRWYRLLNS